MQQSQTEQASAAPSAPVPSPPPVEDALLEPDLDGVRASLQKAGVAPVRVPQFTQALAEATTPTALPASMRDWIKASTTDELGGIRPEQDPAFGAAGLRASLARAFSAELGQRVTGSEDLDQDDVMAAPPNSSVKTDGEAATPEVQLQWNLAQVEIDKMLARVSAGSLSGEELPKEITRIKSAFGLQELTVDLAVGEWSMTAKLNPEGNASGTIKTGQVEDKASEALLISFPDYLIDTESFLGKVSGLGHAGVLLIRHDGFTRYYEYGRYSTQDGTKGRVRKMSVPNAVIGADGKATPASMEKILAKISKQSGQGGRIDSAYFQNVNFAVMESYAQKKLKESNPGNSAYDKDRDPYELLRNNCGTFAEDVITQDKSVDQAWYTTPSPNNIVEEYQDEGNAKLTYDPKAKAGERMQVGEWDEEDAKKKP